MMLIRALPIDLRNGTPETTLPFIPMSPAMQGPMPFR